MLASVSMTCCGGGHHRLSIFTITIYNIVYILMFPPKEFAYMIHHRQEGTVAFLFVFIASPLFASGHPNINFLTTGRLSTRLHYCLSTFSSAFSLVLELVHELVPLIRALVVYFLVTCAWNSTWTHYTRPSTIPSTHLHSCQESSLLSHLCILTCARLKSSFKHLLSTRAWTSTWTCCTHSITTLSTCLFASCLHSHLCSNLYLNSLHSFKYLFKHLVLTLEPFLLGMVYDTLCNSSIIDSTGMHRFLLLRYYVQYSHESILTRSPQPEKSQFWASTIRWELLFVVVVFFWC
jgi:hypothetical protein